MTIERVCKRLAQEATFRFRSHPPGLELHMRYDGGARRMVLDYAGHEWLVCTAIEIVENTHSQRASERLRLIAAGLALPIC